MASNAARAAQLLKKMWVRKTAPLLRDIGLKKAGPVPAFDRRYREGKIRQLGFFINQGMRKDLQKWVKKKASRKSVLLGGTNGKNKWAVLRARLARQQKRRNLVYAFWRDGQCLKVGRSEKGLGRIKQQKETVSFQRAKRVTVFFPKDNRKRSVPALECALTHLFEPPAPMKPAKRKWRDQCTVCKLKSRIKNQVRRLFPL